MPPPLQVFWDDEPIATLTAKRPWDLRCRYHPSVVDAMETNAPLLSCSLPVRRQAMPAGPFLRGLLPEGRHLQSMAALAELATNDTYGLLARFGRDVAGALRIAAEGDAVDRPAPAAEEYTESEFADDVIRLDDQSLGLRDDSELSLAGLQDKLLLVELADGRWGRPRHGAPSTHILKVDDLRFPGLIAAEAASLRLAAAIGLTAIEPMEVKVADRDCLIVRRFDRVAEAGTVRRIHQEDLCQALGIDPVAQQGRAKYERAGGPRLAQMADLLSAHSDDPSRDLAALLAATTLNGLIGNADAHGKNFALLHDRVGRVRLAPLYDLVPTMLWPSLRTEMAMSINGRFAPASLSADDLVGEARRWSMPHRRAEEVVAGTIDRALESLSVVGHDRLVDLIRGRAQDLSR